MPRQDRPIRASHGYPGSQSGDWGRGSSYHVRRLQSSSGCEIADGGSTKGSVDENMKKLTYLHQGVERTKGLSNCLINHMNRGRVSTVRSYLTSQITSINSKEYEENQRLFTQFTSLLQSEIPTIHSDILRKCKPKTIRIQLCTFACALQLTLFQRATPCCEIYRYIQYVSPKILNKVLCIFTVATKIFTRGK